MYLGSVINGELSLNNQFLSTIIVIFQIKFNTFIETVKMKLLTTNTKLIASTVVFKLILKSVTTIEIILLGNSIYYLSYYYLMLLVYYFQSIVLRLW